MCNCYTECVIYENEPSRLAWMVNFEKCHTVAQRPAGHIKTYHLPRQFLRLTGRAVTPMQRRRFTRLCFWYSHISFENVYIIYSGYIWLWMYIFSFVTAWFYCFLNALYNHCEKIKSLLIWVELIISRCLPDSKTYIINVSARIKKLRFFVNQKIRYCIL